MRINGITKYNPAFERRLRKDEEEQCRKDIQKALDELDIKNNILIMHGSSFPSDGRDADIGSPVSKAANKFIDFIKIWGYNGIQLGPSGEPSKSNNSPYLSTVFAKNEMFINLDELTTDKYAKILSKDTYRNVTGSHKIINADYNMTNFNNARKNYEIALTESCDNFRKKVAEKDPKALKLNQEFRAFKKKNNKWLIQNGLFKVLEKQYGNQDFDNWKDLDKNLITMANNKDPKAIARIRELISENSKMLGKNNFTQFIADKQLKEHKQYREKIGFKYINDLLISFSKSDEWANQDAFVSNLKIGANAGGYNYEITHDDGRKETVSCPQAWDAPLLNPKRLFKNDGTLDIAGQLLKEKLDASLEHFENIRIDHALGLIAPFVYYKDSVVRNENDNVLSLNGGFIDENKWEKEDPVNPDNVYMHILERIVFPSLEEHGLTQDTPVWEDLGAWPRTFKYLYHDVFKLPRMINLENMRKDESKNRNNWALNGSHDTPNMLKTNCNNNWGWYANYLSELVIPELYRVQERKDLESLYYNEQAEANSARADIKKKLNENIEPSEEEMNKSLLFESAKAKNAELYLTSDNVQTTFYNLFGITDKIYNVGGQEHPDNWKLRLNNDYIDTYYKELQKPKPKAMNIPEILAMAVRSKMGAEINEKNANWNYEIKDNIKNKYEGLLRRLDHWTSVLKEKERENTEKAA